MDPTLIHDIIYNAALLLSLGIIYDTFSRRKELSKSHLNDLIFGLLISLVALFLMTTPAVWSQGVIFDTRTILISLTGLFFGPLTTLVTILGAILYRSYLGGSGTLMGVATILSSGFIGMAWRHYRIYKGDKLSVYELYFFGLVVHCFMLLCFFLLPDDIRKESLKALGAPVIVIYPLVSMLLGCLLCNRKKRLRYEVSLLTSARDLKAILQTTMDGFWRVNLNGNLLDVNDSYCRLSGYTRQELLSMNIADVEACQTKEEIAAGILELKNCEHIRFESKHKHKNCTLVNVEISAQYLKIGDGQIVCFIRDITETKKAEQELRNSQKLYCDLVERTPDLIIRVDRNGTLLFVNHSAKKFYGVPEDECIGISSFDFIHPEDRQKAITEFSESLNDAEGTFTYGNRLLSKDGKIYHVAWSIRAEHDDNGKICGFAATARDMTRAMQAEQERRQMEEQLHQAQKLESIGQLAGGIAHDFNNMLSVIIGSTELAHSKCKGSAAIADNLTDIYNAARRSADLTRQLLAFARKQNISPQTINLNELVEGMLKMLKRLIGENIDIVWEGETGTWSVNIDPSQFDNIMTNLCLNARDAISGFGTITIRTQNTHLDENDKALHPEIIPGDYVLFSIEDDGCGIDDQSLLNIFDPFFTTKGIGQGTGLGLASVMGAVKQNHGYIYAQSEVDRGTIFKIYFPRDIRETQNKKKIVNYSNHEGSETILLVEDDKMLLQLTATILKGYGYRVLEAHTPEIALSVCREQPGSINLLITDMIMPVMNGKELSEKIQSFFPEIKVLFISGYSSDIISDHGVLQKGSLLLQKPVSSEILTTKVREILDA